MQLIISRAAQIDPSLAAYGSARAFVASKQAGARYHEAHFANIPLLQKKFQSPFRIDGAVPREQIKFANGASGLEFANDAGRLKIANGINGLEFTRRASRLKFTNDASKLKFCKPCSQAAYVQKAASNNAYLSLKSSSPTSLYVRARATTAP